MDNNPTPAHMSWRKPGSMILAGLLVFSVAALAMSHVTPAFAAVSMGQDNSKIYGSGLGRALITDTALQGSPQDTILVHVDAKRGTTTLGSQDVQVKEIGSSGQFELFVTTANAPFNPASSTFAPGNSTNAYVVRINTAPIGDANDGTIPTSSQLKDGDSIVLTYGGQTSTFLFQKSIATVSVDRTTAGTGTLVTVRITDNDGNMDPTKVDTFVANSSMVKALIGGVDKAVFATSSPVFTETGQNTGAFEHTFQVNGTATASQSVINLVGVSMPQSVSFSAIDHDVYSPATGAVSPYNSSLATTNTPSTSVTLSNDDGSVAATAPVTMANGLQLQVTDPDRNIDTAQRDIIPAGQVNVTVAGLTGTVNNVAFKETGDNTGVFVPDITDSKIPIVFGASSSVGANSITMNSTTIGANKDITVSYHDAHSSSNNAATFNYITHLTHSAGTFTGPGTSVGVTGTFGLTLTDPDLNTNPNSVESYTVTFPTGSPTSTAAMLPSNIGGFTVTAAGQAWTPTTTPFTMTFIETGANTGVFTASNIKMQSINNGNTLNDGDQVEFKFADNGESPVQTSTVDVTVGAPGKSIELSRTTVPLPVNGDISKVVLTVTDPSKDLSPGSTDTITMPANAFSMTLKDGTVVGLPTMSGFTGVTLTETGLSTGVFTTTLNVGQGSATTADMDNAKIKATYSDVSASMTVRSYDGTLTSSSSNVANGQNVTITVADQDMNKDPTIREKIGGVTLTTKNDQVGSPITISDLEETGADTGVFTKTLVIGKDIKVGDLSSSTFSTEIDAKYTDAIASDASINVARELTMHVKTSSGSIDVTPTAVGPGSKVSIMVHDNDLNTNPQGTDRTTSGQEYIRITSDRSGVNTLNTAVGEETGPNTGIMKTTLTLSPLTSGTAVFSGNTKDITGKVLPGDIVSIRYTDQADASGNKVTISKTFKVMSVDPTMNATSATVTAGNSFGITVSDLDANTDGEAVDSINVRVTSDSDIVGMTTTLLETGPNTGVFTGTISTSTGVSAGSITVKTGDNVSVKYTDKYPADYSQRVKQVVDASKDFTFIVPVGVASGGDVTATTPSNPVVKDFSNQDVSEVTSGKQVVLSTTVTNNQDTVRPFAAIVEVRNADGITVYLQWQTGSLTPNGNTNVGLSWTPDAPGAYTVRTFVVNNIANPAALSQIASTTINVS